MSSGVTIQDIANALQLSRNTVSKALNGKYVPPKTRTAVLNAAIEMGYKGFGMVASEEVSADGEKILLLSSRLLLNINYYVSVMRGVEAAATERNIELNQFTLTSASSLDKLRAYLYHYHIDGIICIELFDTEKIEELMELDRPVVFLDLPLTKNELSGNYDIVLPENFDCVRNFCMQTIRKTNKRKFGFVGDYTHCRSFYERFLGMREALFLSDIIYDKNLSILEKDDFPYADPQALFDILSQKKQLPDCFICANDTIAVSLTEALKMLKLKIPNEIMVTGFDNVNEAKVHNPPLSTFNVDKAGLGKKLLTVLLERINDKSQRNRVIYLKSKFIPRTTTSAL
ncbi:MAG: LacI family DNA-binding transcriptional regulator [Clostridia bacterium]|nr:LacI family DNA-binding transcriptional regulator [Clostridia bacterium]